MPAESRGYTVVPGQVETFRNPLGGDVTFLARSEHTGGTVTAFESTVPPGDGPPLHIHTREEEWIYVLEGDLRWKLDGELSNTPAGSFIFIPRGQPHCFQNIGSGDARILISFAPAGMEGFFDKQAELTEFDPEAFRAAGAVHGMDVVGPPLAESDPL